MCYLRNFYKVLNEFLNTWNFEILRNVNVDFVNLHNYGILVIFIRCKRIYVNVEL